MAQAHLRSLNLWCSVLVMPTACWRANSASTLGTKVANEMPGVLSRGKAVSTCVSSHMLVWSEWGAYSVRLLFLDPSLWPATSDTAGDGATGVWTATPFAGTALVGWRGEVSTAIFTPDMLPVVIIGLGWCPTTAAVSAAVPGAVPGAVSGAVSGAGAGAVFAAASAAACSAMGTAAGCSELRVSGNEARPGFGLGWGFAVGGLGSSLGAGEGRTQSRRLWNATDRH